MTGSSYNKYQN